MNFRKYFTVIFLTVLFPLIYADLTADDDPYKWGKIRDEDWDIGAPADYPEADAVVVFDRGKLFIGRDGNKFKRHLRIKILTEAGVDAVGDLAISYYKDDKIKGLEAHTIFPGGDKQKVKEYFEQKHGSWRTKTFAFPMLSPGCFVELKYENRNERYVTVDPWYFQSNIYTMYSEYVLILEDGFTFSTATINLPSHLAQPKIEKIADRRDFRKPKLIKHTWVVENFPPIKDEPYMNFPESYMASIYNQIVSYQSQYGFYPYVKNWEELGKEFIDDDLDDFVRKEGDIPGLTDRIVAGINDPLEKARAVYYYVQDSIETKNTGSNRYLNLDGLRDVYEQRFANGDEKNVLLTRMLEYCGFESYPVLIGRRDENLFMPELYHWRQFSRLINMVKINNQFYFLDSRSRYGRFGILPPNSRMAGGLCLDPEGSYIVRLILDDPGTRRVDRNIIAIEPDGNVSCSTDVEIGGYFAMESSQALDKSSNEDFLKEKFLEKLDGTYTYSAPTMEKQENGDINMHFDYQVGDVVKNLDDMYIIKPIRFAYKNNPFKSRDRYFPIDFGYPFQYQNITEIIVPEGMVPEELPEPVEYVTTAAGFSQTSVFDGKRIVITSTLKIEQSVFIKEVYRSFQELFDLVASSAENQIVVAPAVANE